MKNFSRLSITVWLQSHSTEFPRTFWREKLENLTCFGCFEFFSLICYSFMKVKSENGKSSGLERKADLFLSISLWLRREGFCYIFLVIELDMRAFIELFLWNFFFAAVKSKKNRYFGLIQQGGSNFSRSISGSRSVSL